MANYGHVFKDKRLEKGLTQRQLAEKLDMTQSAVSNYEAGRSNPRLPTLLKMTEYLDIRLQDFK